MYELLETSKWKKCGKIMAEPKGLIRITKGGNRTKLNSVDFSETDRDRMTNLSFVLGYFHRYRYLRSRILESDIDRIHEVFHDLKEEQIESIVAMLQVELVVNAVMYCQDLAAIFLAFNKPIKEILKTVSSLHDTGSGSIKEFYEMIPQRDSEYFWKLIKYDKLKIEKEVERHERSCERFRNDMLRLSKFFLRWYELFSAFKHGLNIVALRDAKTAKDVVQIGNQDGSFDMLILHPSWYLEYIEIVDIVLRMFDRVIEPVVWMMLEDVAEVDLKEKRDIQKKLVSREPEDEKRPYRATIEVSFPWKIREEREYRPFY